MAIKSIFHNKCFMCIRDVPFEHDWEFVWECSWAVMDKMSRDEVNELASEVLQFVKKHYPYDYCGHTANMVGDSYARIYIYTMTHGGYLRDSYKHVAEVRGTIREAADVSMPAWGICSMFESEKVPMPECWLDKPCETM